jgi:hypothetical protein
VISITGTKRFRRWCVSEGDLRDLNPAKARDLIIRCFYEAQKETFARAKQRLGTPSDDEDVHRSVVAAVRLAFKETGGDFGEPTKESLAKVVECLAEKATSWGTPQDIVNHHKGEIRKVLDCLKE